MVMATDRVWVYDPDSHEPRSYADILDRDTGEHLGMISLDGIVGGLWVAEPNPTGATSANPAHYTRKRDAAQAVANGATHQHTVSLYRRATSSMIRDMPPVWGTWVHCTCGYRSMNVAGEARYEATYHLDHVEQEDAS